MIDLLKAIGLILTTPIVIALIIIFVAAIMLAIFSPLILIVWLILKAVT